MTNLLSTITFFLKKLHLERLFAIILVGYLSLPTSIAFGQNSSSSDEKLLNKIDQTDSYRPKTTGEWQREAQATEGRPVKRLERIGKESAEAVKEFVQEYPKMAGGTQKSHRKL
jgi:hypothetical protein